MKLLRYLTAISMTLSMVGCCCGPSCLSDGCDPCGMSCGPRPVLFPRIRGALRGYSSYGYDSYGGFPVDGGCSSCGGGGDPMMSTYGGMPSTGSPGCNCGASSAPSSFPPSTFSGSTNYPPAVPPASSSPTPIPSPDHNNAAPLPPSSPTTPSDIPPAAMIPPAAPNTQMVSYEEFQKLPGTVVSGPGVTSPAMSSSSGTAPRLFNRPLGGTSQAPVWVQAK